MLRFIKGKIKARQATQAWRHLQLSQVALAEEITSEQWPDSRNDPTAFYWRCCHYYERNLDPAFREHRQYFTKNGRGFGENAFHTMWYLLFRQFRPASFLEIGVFRGQSLSFASMLARKLDLNCFVQGISPFSSAGDAVSRYQRGVDYYTDTLKNFAHFNLPAPALLRAFSTAEPAHQLIASRTWSIIYIDGNHDYEIARQDWELCARHLQPGGLIVLDDSGLTTSYRPPAFASAGHPGPSRLAQEISRTLFRELLQVGHNRVFQMISA